MPHLGRSRIASLCLVAAWAAPAVAQYPDPPVTAITGVPASGLAADVLKYIHDAAKASIEANAFQAFARACAIEVDYRAPEQLKKVVWDEYRAHTEILARSGMLKK